MTAKALGPYSPIVRAGDWLVCSGQLGIKDGALAEGIVEQTAQAMANLRAVLEGEGASLNDVVKTTIFLSDIDNWPVMNEPYLAALGDHRPARSAVRGGRTAARRARRDRGVGLCRLAVVIGAILVVIAIVIVMPIGFMMMGAAISALFGATLKSHAEATHEGSELIDTNY